MDLKAFLLDILANHVAATREPGPPLLLIDGCASQPDVARAVARAAQHRLIQGVGQT